MSVLAALLQGCGYSRPLRSTVIPAGQSVDVRMFANRTYQPNIDAELRRAFVNELAARGERIGGDLSDYVVSGEIAVMTNEATAFSAIDQAKLYRIVLEVHSQLTERKSGNTVWKGGETSRQEYPANTDLALQRNAHDAAVSAACAAAARVLVGRMKLSF